MEAKELRIGNYVRLFRKPEHDFKSDVLVIGIDEINVQIGDGFLVNLETGIEPIPLTEEWLIKFGFKTDFYGGQGNVCYYASKGKFKIYSIEDNKSYQYDRARNMFVMIKHVHQLQNLYHALTGEELTIKK